MDAQRTSARTRRLIRALKQLRKAAGLNTVTAAERLGVRVDRKIRKALLELHERAGEPGRSTGAS